MLAAQLTSGYGRSQVLEWYLNSADYGNFAYGIDAAAQLYFGKSATDLTPAECAVLAAASQAPGLNPLDASDLALQRGRTTIDLMRTFHLITPAEADQALGEKLSFAAPAKSSLNDQQSAERVSLFTSLVLKQLGYLYTRDRITRGGLIITAALDYDLQTAAAATVLGDATASSPSSSSLILDPQSGQILAATGETLRGQETSLLSPRDPGTLLSPFIYLTAFTRGFGPASLVWDIPSVDSASVLPASAPQSATLAPGAGAVNSKSSTYHGPVRMRIALANDYAAPVQAIAAQMGPDAISRTESC